MPTKQKSGLYRTKVKIGVDASGKNIYKWVSGKTQRELEDEKRRIIDRYITGTATDTDQLFGAYVVEWFNVYRNPRVREVTGDNYRVNLNTHILPAFGDRQIRAISSADVQQWLDSYAGGSSSLIDKLYMLIRAIFKSAHADGVVSRDVTARLSKPRARKQSGPRSLTASETKALLNTMTGHPQGLLLAVLYYLGLRRGEALGLKWGDFDFDERMVHIQRDVVYVRGKTTLSSLKTAAADRYVILPAPLLSLLKPQRGLPQAWLFPSTSGEPLCYTSYKRQWASLMVHAGLAIPKELSEAAQRKKPNQLELMDQYDFPITAQYLRHNYVTKLFYAGVPAVLAMWMVGHESYETTVDVYTHLRKARFQEAPVDMEWVYEVKSEAIKIQTPDSILNGSNFSDAPSEKGCTKVAQAAPSPPAKTK